MQLPLVSVLHFVATCLPILVSDLVGPVEYPYSEA